MIAQHTMRRRVQFYETDAAGMVHFTSYFRYMEEAEHALWRELGLSIAPEGSEIGFPRISASFEYRRPLHFEQEIDVTIRVVSISARTIDYACEITRDGTSVATGAIRIACVSKRPGEPIKSTAIPAEIVERFRR